MESMQALRQQRRIDLDTCRLCQEAHAPSQLDAAPQAETTNVE
jgi:hypothetical protein